MICLNREVNYRGAIFRIIIETTNDIICKEILSIVERGELSRLLELIKLHGGCKILSENPLKVISGDQQITITSEPLNPLAKQNWGLIVSRVKDYCRH